MGLTANRYEVSVWGDENVLELNRCCPSAVHAVMYGSAECLSLDRSTIVKSPGVSYV